MLTLSIGQQMQIVTDCHIFHSVYHASFSTVEA